MHRRHALWIMMLCLVPLLAACGPPWKAVIQANPNPFYAKGRFGVIPITMNGMLVGDKTESEWMSEKDGDQRVSWDEDKKAMNEKFTNSLLESGGSEGLSIVRATNPADAPFMVRANITFLEPGIYSFVFNQPTEIRMTVQITDPSGRVLDEVILSRSSPATIANPSSGGRERDAADQLGRLMARYLLARTRGDE